MRKLKFLWHQQSQIAMVIRSDAIAPGIFHVEREPLGEISGKDLYTLITGFFDCGYDITVVVS